MFRPPAIVALFMALGLGTCQQDGCGGEGCGLTTRSFDTSFGASVFTGNVRTIEVPNCSTCAHSTFRVVWQFDPMNIPPLAGEEVHVQLRFRCEGKEELIYQTPGAPAVRVFKPGVDGEPVGGGSTTFSDINVKNHCGERARVDYYIGVNNYTFRTINVDVHATCAEYAGSSGSPTSPS